jgi:hypothetical protein
MSWTTGRIAKTYDPHTSAEERAGISQTTRFSSSRNLESGTNFTLRLSAVICVLPVRGIFRILPCLCRTSNFPKPGSFRVKPSVSMLSVSSDTMHPRTDRTILSASRSELRFRAVRMRTAMVSRPTSNCVRPVEIKIAPIVTRELEEKKTLHQSRKIQERAATALRLLHSYHKQPLPAVVREGVTLEFVVKEPDSAFVASQDLNLQIADDRLIGTLLLYRERAKHPRCVLITGDLPLMVKASHYEIEVIEPNETLRLPPELDETEKKLKQTQAELLRYQSREPKLEVLFEDEEKYQKFEMSARSNDPEAEIRAMLDAVRQKHPLLEITTPPQPPAPFVSPNPLVAVAMASVDMQSIGRRFDVGYNDRLKTYYEDYEKWLRATSSFRSLVSRTIELELKVKNIGTCPAEDVHVLLHFPDGFTLYNEDDLPRPGKEPAVPTKTLGLVPGLAALSVSPNIQLTRLHNSGLARIRKTNSYDVEFSHNKLQHNFDWTLDPLYLSFDSWESTSSFAIQYTIHAGNMIDDQRGELAVIVEKKEP